MKLLAFTDVHNNISIIKEVIKQVAKHKPDLLICCGDITLFGEGLIKVLKKINELNIKCLIIPGNHEEHTKLEDEIRKLNNLVYLDNSIFISEEFIFVGSGGGWFNDKTPKFEKFYKLMSKKLMGKKIVFISHQPPYNTSLDDLDYFGNVGNKTYRRFIEEFKPILALSGHLHENFGKLDKIGKTIVINPGPLGRIIEI